MKKIKVGQIGIGHNHGEAKIKGFRKFPELFEVVGYAEEDERWIDARGNMDGYCCLKRMTVDEIIEKCDAVVICIFSEVILLILLYIFSENPTKSRHL